MSDTIDMSMSEKRKAKRKKRNWIVTVSLFEGDMLTTRQVNFFGKYSETERVLNRFPKESRACVILIKRVDSQPVFVYNEQTKENVNADENNDESIEGQGDNEVPPQANEDNASSGDGQQPQPNDGS